MTDPSPVGRFPGAQMPPHNASPRGTRPLPAHTDVLDLIVKNAALPTVLRLLTSLLESEIPNARAAVLLLDDDGRHIHVGAAPSLPAAYNAAIEGEPIGPRAGTCGTAMYEKRAVITPDVSADPAWTDYRAAAEAAQVRACWSAPFFGTHGRVLGALAVYFADRCYPETSTLLFLHDMGYLAAVAVQQDVMRQRLHDNTRTHPLTGLANRVAMGERLRAAQVEAARVGADFAVVHVGIEGMSRINESLGYSTGDVVLRVVGQRLTHLVGSAGLVAHMWGSEFVVLADRLEHAEDPDAADPAVALAERVRTELTRPLEVNGMTLVIEASVGLARSSEARNGQRTSDEPLRRAHVARDRAKVAGTGEVAIYDSEWDPSADLHLLAPALRRGIDQDELALAYQPIVDLADRNIEHFEALLRWTTPHGAVSPDWFVPVAERTGMVQDLGRYAIARAIADIAALRATGARVGVSVNLSVRQLADTGLPDLIAELLNENDMQPAALTLEVTEGVLLGSKNRDWATLDRIRELGVRVSLDDFGTGFSQINYLRRFHFDEIKIDRTFIADMTTDRTARAIIVGTVGLAREAGMMAVAEGIETEAQADELRELGVAYGQGYLFGRPDPTPRVPYLAGEPVSATRTPDRSRPAPAPHPGGVSDAPRQGSRDASDAGGAAVPGQL